MKLFQRFLQEVAKHVAKSDEVSDLIKSTLEIVKNSQEIVDSQDSLAKEINVVLSKFDARIKALEEKPQKKVLKVKKGEMVIEEAK